MSSGHSSGGDPEDEDLVKAFLRVTKDLSQKEAADRAEGITQKDVSRWERGEWSWLTAKKRRALKAFLEDGPDRATAAASSAAPPPRLARGADPFGSSPADRLIAVLSHPEVRRQLPLNTPMDLVKTAFGIALDEDFSDEELEKLARWREEVRDRPDDDAPPTRD